MILQNWLRHLCRKINTPCWTLQQYPITWSKGYRFNRDHNLVARFEIGYFTLFGHDIALFAILTAPLVLKNPYTFPNPAAISHFLTKTPETDFALYFMILQLLIYLPRHLFRKIITPSLTLQQYPITWSKALNLIFLFFSLGDGEGSMPLSWTTLNPMTLVQQMKSFNFEFDSFEEFMKMVSFCKVVNALCKF